MRRISSFVSLLGLGLLSLSGCETYEFPPRLSGVGTDNCPACDVFVLEESRLPLGGVSTISAEFAFEDEQGTLSGVRVFVTTPSGNVLEEASGGDEALPGFPCEFRAESLTTPVATCDLVSDRETSIGSVVELLDGIEQGRLSVNFGVDLTEVGEWTVELEAENSEGARSNRLSSTFDVVEGLGDDDDS